MTGSGEQLRHALADRYTIERELGRGGHAVVYLAHDRKHNRHVAIKVLLAELSLSVSVERFRREIELASQLTHPHILGLIDSGEAAGCLYYVMPYVAGETLRDRLRRAKQLALDESLRIVREVAEALSHAHRQGVVHRDIKPENILLHEGHALVADFGIARALASSGAETITQTGVSVGTPQYMSPEQASGAGEVDGRSDVYSLACVLFEMLSGHVPYAGTSAQELVARHALDPVPSLRAARPDVPEGIERSVAKALAKVPVARFATATDFVTALDAPHVGTPPRRRKGLYVTAAVAILAVGGALLARSAITGPSGPSVQPSVAVLPFINMTGDSANEYFSDGITEELINALVQIEGLRVPARTSSFAFKGKMRDIRDIGRQLNVAHVLEGSFRRDGDSVRITAQLIQVADGYHVWSATYDRALRGVLAMQEELGRSIVAALEVKLRSGGTAALARRYTENVAAYDLYLRGRYFFNRRTKANLDKAIDYFRRAIAQDSGYALAYSGLADAYVAPPVFAYPQAKVAALRAVALDESLPEAHTSLARVYQTYDWDWRGAEREYRRAIALNPRYAQARSWYGLFLARQLGRVDQAVREASAGHALDPLSPSANNILAIAMNVARRHDEAIEYARRAVDLAPDWVVAHSRLGNSYRWKGMFREALAEYEIAASMGARENRGAVGAIYARTGRRAEALAVLKELEARSRRENVWENLATLYGALGEDERALQALDSLVAQRPFVSELRIATALDWESLHSHPRFKALLKRVGLQ